MEGKLICGCSANEPVQLLTRSQEEQEKNKYNKWDEVEKKKNVSAQVALLRQLLTSTAVYSLQDPQDQLPLSVQQRSSVSASPAEM